MKTFFLFVSIIFFSFGAKAQFTKASLQASGLTCSMCSKAVLNALQKVEFVEKVQVDIKNQRYNLTFKEGASIDFDALGKAVEDAGFSVAALNVTANMGNIKLQKDQHITIGGKNFHFLNGANQQLTGITTFSIVDKAFVPAKQFKKYSAATKMECVQTGRMATCCKAENAAAHTRIYHVVI